MRIRHTAATILITTLAATACSSNDSSTDDTPAKATTPAPSQTAPDTADLEQAVRDYTAALFSGNADGYDLVSARCQKQMTKTEWVTKAEGAHQQYGSQKATGVEVDQLSGDLARVSYGAGNIPQFEREGQSWTREGGTWRWDACPSTS